MCTMPLSIYLLCFVQARHMVIPYLPMLIPPKNWKGYVIDESLKYLLGPICFKLFIICSYEEGLDGAMDLGKGMQAM